MSNGGDIIPHQRRDLSRGGTRQIAPQEDGGLPANLPQINERQLGHVLSHDQQRSPGDTTQQKLALLEQVYFRIYRGLSSSKLQKPLPGAPGYGTSRADPEIAKDVIQEKTLPKVDLTQDQLQQWVDTKCQTLEPTAWDAPVQMRALGMTLSHAVNHSSDTSFLIEIPDRIRPPPEIPSKGASSQERKKQDVLDVTGVGWHLRKGKGLMVVQEGSGLYASRWVPNGWGGTVICAANEDSLHNLHTLLSRIGGKPHQVGEEPNALAARVLADVGRLDATLVKVRDRKFNDLMGRRSSGQLLPTDLINIDFRAVEIFAWQKSIGIHPTSVAANDSEIPVEVRADKAAAHDVLSAAVNSSPGTEFHLPFETEIYDGRELAPGKKIVFYMERWESSQALEARYGQKPEPLMEEPIIGGRRVELKGLEGPVAYDVAENRELPDSNAGMGPSPRLTGPAAAESSELIISGQPTEQGQMKVLPPGEESDSQAPDAVPPGAGFRPIESFGYRIRLMNGAILDFVPLTDSNAKRVFDERLDKENQARYAQAVKTDIASDLGRRQRYEADAKRAGEFADRIHAEEALERAVEESRKLQRTAYVQAYDAETRAAGAEAERSHAEKVLEQAKAAAEELTRLRAEELSIRRIKELSARVARTRFKSPEDNPINPQQAESILIGEQNPSIVTLSSVAVAVAAGKSVAILEKRRAKTQAEIEFTYSLEHEVDRSEFKVDGDKVKLMIGPEGNKVELSIPAEKIAPDVFQQIQANPRTILGMKWRASYSKDYSSADVQATDLTVDVGGQQRSLFKENDGVDIPLWQTEPAIAPDAALQQLLSEENRTITSIRDIPRDMAVDIMRQRRQELKMPYPETQIFKPSDFAVKESGEIEVSVGVGDHAQTLMMESDKVNPALMKDLFGTDGFELHVDWQFRFPPDNKSVTAQVMTLSTQKPETKPTTVLGQGVEGGYMTKTPLFDREGKLTVKREFHGLQED